MYICPLSEKKHSLCVCVCVWKEELSGLLDQLGIEPIQAMNQWHCHCTTAPIWMLVYGFTIFILPWSAPLHCLKFTCSVKVPNHFQIWSYCLLCDGGPHLWIFISPLTATFTNHHTTAGTSLGYGPYTLALWLWKHRKEVSLLLRYHCNICPYV